MAKYIVRYGVMRLLGVFSPSGGGEYRRGTAVIARTDRGLEAAEVLCEALEAAVADPEGRQRRPNPPGDDPRRSPRIEPHSRADPPRTPTLPKHVDRLKLSMQLVDVEHIFGGERIVVYYLAESRVDFRELVRILAGEFQTRIEMRQIGVRDEAKLLADYGDCGIPVCCNTHLAVMPPVSMKMAKMQKATLDPTKISGRCGRLKCCLRYEYDTYEQAQKEAPAEGAASEALPPGDDLPTGRDDAPVSENHA